MGALTEVLCEYEILTMDIGAATAKIMQHITNAAEPPEPMSDDALADVGRALLATTIERVTAATYISSPTGRTETGP